MPQSDNTGPGGLPSWLDLNAYTPKASSKSSSKGKPKASAKPAYTPPSTQTVTGPDGKTYTVNNAPAPAATPTASGPTSYSQFSTNPLATSGFNTGTGVTINSSTGSASAQNLDTLPVYTGEHVMRAGRAIHNGEKQGDIGGTAVPVQRMAADIIHGLYSLNGAQLKALQEKLYLGGYMTRADVNGVFNNGTRTAMSGLLTDTSLYNDPAVTWQSVLDKAAGQNSRGTKGGSAGNTQTDKHFTVTDPETAKGVVNSALQQYLGRDATPAEQASFYAALRSKESADPRVTTQQTDPMSGNTTTTVSGGVAGAYAGSASAAETQMAQDFAKSNPDYGNYQAATTYMDVISKLTGAGA